MDSTFLKRRYYDMRLGGTQVSPIIQMANFVAISFLYIRHIISIEVFAPVFLISGFIALSYIGVRFRKHQASTDYDMLFEKQTQQAKILYQIMKALGDDKERSEEFKEQLSYLKEISKS